MPRSNPTAASGAGFTLGDLLRVLRRRWFALAGTAIAVAVAVFLLGRNRTPIFEARANLAVNRSRRVAAVPGAAAPRIDAQVLNTERDRLLAAENLRAALEASQLDQQPPFVASRQPVSLLRSRVQVQPSPDSWMLRVALRDERAQYAHAALEALIDAYRRNRSAIQRERAEAAAAHLEAHIDAARDELDATRAALRDYQLEHDLVTLDPEDNRHARRLAELLPQLTRLEQQLFAAELLVERADAIREGADADVTLDGGDWLSLPGVAEDPLVRDLHRDLLAAEGERATLAVTYKPAHPRLRQADGQLGIIRDQLRAGVERVVAGLTTTRETLRRQVAELERSVDEERAELADYRSRLIELSLLRERQQDQRELMRELDQQRRRQVIAGQMVPPVLEVLDPAFVSPYPVNRHTRLFLGAGVFLGLIAGVIAALLAEAVDPRVRNRDDLTRLAGHDVEVGVPIKRALHHRPRKPWTPAQAAQDEAFAWLSTAIMLRHRQADRGGGCIVVVSSPSPGDGKTTVAAHLALAAAKARHRTLLVDADFRHPALQRRFDLKRQRGFSFLLAGEDDIAPEHHVVDQLDVLPLGVSSGNAQALLHEDRLAESLERWTGEYDLIIFDTAPLALVSDAVVLASLADELLLVIRRDRTSRAAVREVVERLAEHGTEPRIVFNGEARGRRASYA
ncbi:MAG: GumC family protein [Planctomycetota bacterium]